MKTTVKARNFELSERLRSQIDRKLRRLDRIAHPDAEATVELIANASHATDASHVAEVTMVTNGSVVRSVSSGATAIAALDTLLDKLERQVVRARKKPRAVHLRATDETQAVLAREAEGSVAGDEEVSPRTTPAVVRIKRFDMLPMFEEDAIARMEELGHAFFVFLNAEMDRICVVYRRRDGTYGLIEPVVGGAR
ncbi:MAG TPA: ribosome-associated translation inhibitor RaiA [candidate division Zixibacteria bacterium]|nr:ribosome-associated translation inhibitor RaiA [candidate division Zixibacteria bacterium]